MTSECILFSGSVNKTTGYGKVGTGELAHRRAYEDANGPIPVGLLVRHTCDVRACINPAHLVVGTQKENIQDSIERDRFTIGERNGHTFFTNEQVSHIKWRVLVGRETCTAVARGLGVCRATISHMKSGRTWARVAPVAPLESSGADE